MGSMIGKPVFLGMVVCTLVIGLLVGRQIMATNGALDSKDAPSSSEVAEAMTRVDYSKYQHDLASVEDGLVGVADTRPAGGGSTHATRLANKVKSGFSSSGEVPLCSCWFAARTVVALTHL
jgi:hypothetical protein